KATAASDRLAALVAGEAKVDAALAEGKQALQAGDAKTASLRYRVAENILKTTPRYQQARRDVETGVLGLPLEDWSPARAAPPRARASSPISVAFAPKTDAAVASLAGVRVVRAAGKDSRDLAAAGPGGLRALRRTPSGYRVDPPVSNEAVSDVAVA